MTVNNNRLTSHSVFHHAGLQCYRSEMHKKRSIHINLTHAGRCSWTLSPCLAVSAKLICVKRWIWDEFISTGWESSSHMLGLLGTWELCPYFSWGGSQCNPDRSMEALNGVEIGERYLWRPLRAHTRALSKAEVRILNVTASLYSTWCYDSFLSFLSSVCEVVGEMRWDVLLKMLLWI